MIRSLLEPGNEPWRCECCEETEPCDCEIGEATWHTGVVAPDGYRESTRGPVCFTHRREI